MVQENVLGNEVRIYGNRWKLQVWNTVGVLLAYVNFAGNLPIYAWVWSTRPHLGADEMEAGNLLSPSTWPQETTPYSAQPENRVVGSSLGRNKLGVQRDCTGFSGGSVVKNLPAMQETQETQVWSLNWEDPLENEMATHPGMLAWRIPWTEELSGLQSLGLQRVGHKWATEYTIWSSNKETDLSTVTKTSSRRSMDWKFTPV